MSIIGYPPMNYVMKAIWARAMRLGGHGPWGPMATRLYGYWLVTKVFGYVDMSYMNIDYGYWLFTIGYGI
jgi:hypothetical protein